MNILSALAKLILQNTSWNITAHRNFIYYCCVANSRPGLADARYFLFLVLLGILDRPWRCRQKDLDAAGCYFGVLRAAYSLFYFILSNQLFATHGFLTLNSLGAYVLCSKKFFYLYFMLEMLEIKSLSN